jgi:hypothetical protein
MHFQRVARLMLPGIALALPLILGGCAMVNDRALRLFSSSANAYAIVNGQLLQGNMIFLPDRTGNLTLATDKGAITDCSGQVRYESTTGGSIDLRCSDGVTAQLRYSLLSETRGYAYGPATASAAAGAVTGAASLTFGLPAAQAVAYLTAPPGKKLVVNTAEGLDLQ